MNLNSLKNTLYFITLSISLSGCFKGQKVDLIIHNGLINTLNDNKEVHDAMAIKDGIIVEVGPERQILNKYTANREIDAGSRSVYPNLTDFRTDLFEGVKQQLALDLTNTNSEEELLVRLEKYDQRFNYNFILAYNLDTTYWNSESKVSNTRINSLFPDKPVYLVFVKKKTLLLNSYALHKHKIKNSNSLNEFNLIKNQLPYFNQKVTLKQIDKTLHTFLQYGITNLHVANVSNEQLKTLKKIESKINLYPSLRLNSENFNIEDKLTTCFFIDSSNFPNKDNELKFIDFCSIKNKQVYFNIQDTIQLLKAIDLCKKMNEIKKDHRWIINYPFNLSDQNLEAIYKYGIFLSFSPSDIIQNNNNYNYSKTLQSLGLYLISSNFPTNDLYSYEVIQNATTPNNNNSLNIFQTMKGYCYWSTFAMFKEANLGTLEKGKEASFVIFEKPLKQNIQLNSNYAKYVYQKGVNIYNID